MTGRVAVISPESKPGIGGVADYTLRLLERLPADCDIDVIVPDKYSVVIPQNAAKLLVQYSAYGFSSIGYPRELISDLIDWKKKTGGRLVLMFHEIWSFYPVTNWNFFVQSLHRRAIKRLLQYCDVVFTSTTSQAAHLRAISPNRPVFVLPVGSNVRPIGITKDGRKPGKAILFGLQRTRLRALENMERILRSLAAAKVITHFTAIGGGSDATCLAKERQLLESLALTEGFEQIGHQPEDVISQRMAGTSLGVFGQSELSYEKSCTFMAYAAHELNILADFADSAKAPPICWLVSARELLDGVSAAELKMRARSLRDWQEQTSAWTLIAQKLSEALELNNVEGMQIASR